MKPEVHKTFNAFPDMAGFANLTLIIIIIIIISSLQMKCRMKMSEEI